MMQFLRLSNLFLLLIVAACADPYKDLIAQNPNPSSALKFKPEFDKTLYRCVVDGRFLLKKFHLSGLLFFKHLEDKSTRVVFQNEMGFNFFDFEWNENDSFKVNKIIPQLDKEAVIKILKKDMELFLMKNLDVNSENYFSKENKMYHRFKLENGFAYYITEKEKLLRIENVGKRKITTINIGNKTSLTAMPETVFFDHHKANFTIQLNKLEADVDE